MKSSLQRNRAKQLGNYCLLGPAHQNAINSHAFQPAILFAAHFEPFTIDHIKSPLTYP
jgi:hypothetical protein